jgi:hypothetical protein
MTVTSEPGMSMPIDPKPLPAGTTIESSLEGESWTLTWRAINRHPLQWIPVFFGGFMMVGGMFFLTVDQANPVFQNHWSSIGLFQFCLGAVFLWYGLSRRRREKLCLTSDEVFYDSGPAPVPRWLLMFYGQPMMWGNWFGTADAGGSSFQRRRYTMNVAELGPFTLERVGERQRLRVDHGAERIEIGHILREPEREWLADFLVDWQELTIHQE